ncbi:hypothetical protein FIBSPDRAFT_550068 [Athelia psychrophila]|uniref:G domain-containing protein n=1 Tax=Athelia psychrophila TaxID=1759441 RepID=A0A166USN9_9AGAM|nr:hypothetical protein FIBSPDRAFT_550068 [Fibularhizoctonia sp. CBS 109695]
MQDDSQGSPLENPIPTSERKGSTPVQSASSSKADRGLVSDGLEKDEASKGSAHARLRPTDPIYKHSPKDRVVIVMGPTGAGKSTFIEYATQQSGGHTSPRSTSEIRAVRTKHPYDQGQVIFVDTPGFDETYRSDVEILSQIAGWLVKVYMEKIPLVAIVYLHRISDNRMPRSPLKNLQLFASMCGKEALPDVVLATTMWSETPADIGIQRERQLMGNYWADMIEKGCTVQRFRDSHESAWKIVGILPTEGQNIIISREIHDDKKRLNETSAGVRLTEELNKLIANHKQSARRLDEQAQMPDNVVLVGELQERKTEIEKKIGVVLAQLGTLKIPVRQKLRNFFVGARKTGIYVPPDVTRK